MNSVTLGSTVTIEVLGISFEGRITYCDSVGYVVMYAENNVIKYQEIKF